MMIRKIIVPASKDISIQVPENFVGQHVEIIAFTIKNPNELEPLDNTFTHYASAEALAKDWLTSNEEEAWQDL